MGCLNNRIFASSASWRLGERMFEKWDPFFLFLFLLPSGVLAETLPSLHEPGLTLTLFAEDPDIVTPVGLVVGKEDEVYVIESHTHSRPKGYDGPEGDLIKVFRDTDQDGVADFQGEFAKGFNAAMNLAFSQDGVLFVLCAWTLYALPDRDKDGVCDGPELILTLDTKGTNPHGCWLGITFDEENYLYLSRGNVGGEYWRVEGKDGSVVEGYGDGGNVLRAKADGTGLREWATGFWNAMDLKFDYKGNLMLVDNDPDARGPNRLLRIVEGGDYGHKHLFGGSGRHPFQGWDATFPGHLPYLSGTGEAPSGLIDVSPPGQHSLLITIWNENNVERHTVSESGEVEKTLFMSGGKNFRPVALDQDSQGNLYISDWMLVDYPVHGRGRIWRVSKLPIPEKISKEPDPDPNESDVESYLSDENAFQRHRGELWLAANRRLDLAKKLTRHPNPLVRQGAYLALRRMREKDGTLIERALGDTETDIRRLGLLWASEAMDASLRPALDRVLRAGEVDAVLFNTYLAAVELVNETFIHAYKNRSPTRSVKLPRSLEPGLVEMLAQDTTLPSSVRAEAIKRLEPDQVTQFLSSEEITVLLAAIKKASQEIDPAIQAHLMRLALDAERPSEGRAESLLGLSRQSVDRPEKLIPLLFSRDAAVAFEAARTLRFHVGNSSVRNAFLRLQKDLSVHGGMTDLGELVEFALHGLDPNKHFARQRPQSEEAWLDRLSEGGEVERGSRVFRSVQTMCTTCHTIDEGGSNLGPDLGGIAQSLTRSQIIQAILKPSDSFPPQYQAWNIFTRDGKIHTGLQIDHQAGGAMLLYTLDNFNRRFEAEEVRDYRASPHSLMPEGLENTMTAVEMNDLVAYLTSLN